MHEYVNTINIYIGLHDSILCRIYTAEVVSLRRDIDKATIYNINLLALRKGDHTLSHIYKRLTNSFKMDVLCTILMANAKDPPIMHLGYQACLVIHMDAGLTNRTFQEWTVQYTQLYNLNVTVMKANLAPATGHCVHESISIRLAKQRNKLAELCGFLPKLSFTAPSSKSSITIRL